MNLDAQNHSRPMSASSRPNQQRTRKLMHAFWWIVGIGLIIITSFLVFSYAVWPHDVQ